MTITLCSHDYHTMLTQAIGSYGAGLIDIEELHHIECSALPGSGSCGQFIKHSNTSSLVTCHASCVHVHTQEGCLQQTPCRLL